ncbi:MAG: hypothetical protein PHD97_09965 [Bacteroidales bacterium]|nr:hypothetical protein [Bacteroidales bacterium]
MFEKRILNIYSVIIGIFFIISGIGKVIDTAAFSTLIYQYGLGYSMILSPLIVLIEILLGLFLILLINPKRYSLYSFILLVVFTISFAYAHFKNGINDCGCFGTLQHADMPPSLSFARNFILIIMSFVLWLKYPKERTETLKWKKNLVLSVMFISIFAAGFTFKTPFFFKSKKESHKFQNQNINNTELSKYIKTSADSTYLFFCFTYTCPHCWNSIENLRQFIKSKAVDSVMIFAAGENSDKLFFEKNFHPDFNIKELPAEKMDKLTDAYPTAFYVEHDTVKVIIQSVLPSPITFNKHYKSSNTK